MPCFKGIAVSVHADSAPLPEYSVQKLSRASRVNTYIPVPKPKLSADPTSNKPEPSKFSISITLLTPGHPVPYSTPKPTSDNPHPKPSVVALLPGTSAVDGEYKSSVAAYVPITKSENETIAAYIYFDGRAKEEVATLLRPGEETWVNSRWVQCENGDLAEREFLFREVGLERWLNGLDLDGKDAAAKIEKRRQKLEKRRKQRTETIGSDDDISDRKISKQRDVLKYGEDSMSPVEKISDDDEFSSDSDDDELPEAAGQIKVAMFRVLASGEIKRGEYSPQFGANDDDEETKDGDEADVDHTTSFAKPKTLDPKSISTQTVTGIDGPDKPFATFTFFYRGERQLQKMGMMRQKQPAATGANKRRSTQLDFSSLAPLKPTGTVGFSTFRDNGSSSRKAKARKSGPTGRLNGMVDDSDDDDDDDDMELVNKMDDADDKDIKTSLLSPEDAKSQGELADGVGRIKLKRQHSAEPLNANNTRKSPSIGPPSQGTTPPAEDKASPPQLSDSVFSSTVPPDVSIVGSPLKRHRPSLHMDNDLFQKRMGAGFASAFGNVLGAAEAGMTHLTESPAESPTKSENP